MPNSCGFIDVSTKRLYQSGARVQGHRKEEKGKQSVL